MFDVSGFLVLKFLLRNGNVYFWMGFGCLVPARRAVAAFVDAFAYSSRNTNVMFSQRFALTYKCFKTLHSNT